LYIIVFFFLYFGYAGQSISLSMRTLVSGADHLFTNMSAVKYFH